MLFMLCGEDSYDALLQKYNLCHNVKLSRATLLYKMLENIDSKL